MTCNDSIGSKFQTTKMTKGKEMSEQKIASTTKRIEDLTEHISKVQLELSTIEESMKQSEGNWTQSYTYWDKFEDTEELLQEKIEEEKKLKLAEDGNQFTGHCHDHHEVMTHLIRSSYQYKSVIINNIHILGTKNI
jgi:predicted nuclease with TOPRIM domain